MSALSDLVKLLKQQKKTGSDYTGTVTRVENGMAYVRLTGSEITDTPVSMTINAQPGDKVRVRVSGGRAWITGNDTAPPTNDKENLNKINQTTRTITGQVSDINKYLSAVGKITKAKGTITANISSSGWTAVAGAQLKLKPGSYVIFATGASLITYQNRLIGVLVSNHATVANGLASKEQYSQIQSSTFDAYNAVDLSFPYKVETEVTIYGFIENGSNISTAHRVTLQALRIA